MTEFKRNLSWELLEMMQEAMGAEELLNSLVRKIEAKEVVECLELIAQEHSLADEFDKVVAEAEANK